MTVLAQDDDPEPLREQARSLVMTNHGIVAASQTLASAAGAKILEQGGNAIDAAIAANAVMGLVEPSGNGIGGDLFAIVYEAKTGKLYGLNASGWSPAGLTVDFLEKNGNKTMPVLGIHSATVPGAVAGWEALRTRFGTMPFSKLLAPAIHYAEAGFPVTEWIAEQWRAPKALKVLTGYPNARSTYLSTGNAPIFGEMFRNPDLARSLRSIAKSGPAAFYTGDIAKRILQASKELGGVMTAEDLAEFKADWVTPISTEYRGWTVTELPPNGQGVAALAMLNIMERFPLGEYGHNDGRTLHILMEAKKLAYADMLRYVGDPRFTDIPVKQMLSKELAGQRAKLIDASRAKCEVPPSELSSIAKLPGADTIYLSVVDREGNIVSLIQSNYQGFGSGVVPAGTGFMLHNRGALFTMERNKPNSLVGRKRPLHTIIPGFMSKGDTHIGFGIMGGWNQAQAHAQFVSNIVDHRMNLQLAMEAPRFTKLTFEGCDVMMESRISEQTRTGLEKLGHVIKVVSPYSQRVGGGQAVMRNGKGVNFGASDPRKDGAAVPESPAF